MTAAPARPGRRSARGSTLLEAMVALGIVAVLMSLALPSFGNIVARHRLKAAAENLAADLAELRFQAARRGSATHLHVEAGPDWCYALALASGCGCQPNRHCQLKTVRASDHPGVAMLAGQDALFEVLGGSIEREPTRLGDAGATFGLPQGQQLRVSLSPLGRPRICAPAAPVPGYGAC